MIVFYSRMPLFLQNSQKSSQNNFVIIESSIGFWGINLHFWLNVYVLFALEQDMNSLKDREDCFLFLKKWTLAK